MLSMDDRIAFNNLICRTGDEMFFIIMNLTSFRRKRIGSAEEALLNSAWHSHRAGQKLTEEEQELIGKLQSEKQILSEEVEKAYYEQLKANHPVYENHFPLRAVTLNLTHRCNFACEYCYQKSYQMAEKYSVTMTVEDIDKIAAFLKNPIFSPYELEEVTISGGEPLLPGNEEVINHILNSVPAKKYMLFTNGVNLLTFSKRTNFERIHEFQISLDGTDEVIQAVNHSSVKADAILDGVEMLLSMGKKVRMASTWTKALENNLDAFIELVRSRGFGESENFSIGISSIHEYSQGSGIDKSFYDWDYLLDSEKRYAEKLAEIHASFTVFPEISHFQDIIYRPFNERYDPRVACCAISKSIPLVFEPNGEVHWCACLGKEAGIIANYLTNEIDLDRCRILANRSIFTLGECRGCPMKYICSGGCVLNNFGTENDIMTPVCGIYKERQLLETV